MLKKEQTIVCMVNKVLKIFLPIYICIYHILGTTISKLNPQTGVVKEVLPSGNQT